MEISTEIVQSLHVLEPFPGKKVFDCVFRCASKDHRRNSTVLKILYLFLFLKIMLSVIRFVFSVFGFI